MAEHSNVTERQARYFAALRASLETTTGRSLADWVEIAKDCPETKHRARLKWFKDTHGLLQNRASLVINEAFGSAKPWAEADLLISGLWTDEGARSVYERIDAIAMTIPGVVRTARKGYTAWSRTFQFAAARPLKGGAVLLGLAVSPDSDPPLEPPSNEAWSERLKSRLRIPSPVEVDDHLAGLVREAAANA
jgi:hypothetical protein